MLKYNGQIHYANKDGSFNFCLESDLDKMSQPKTLTIAYCDEKGKILSTTMTDPTIIVIPQHVLDAIADPNSACNTSEPILISEWTRPGYRILPDGKVVRSEHSVAAQKSNLSEK